MTQPPFAPEQGMNRSEHLYPHRELAISISAESNNYWDLIPYIFLLEIGSKLLKCLSDHLASDETNIRNWILCILRRKTWEYGEFLNQQGLNLGSAVLVGGKQG